MIVKLVKAVLKRGKKKREKKRKRRVRRFFRKVLGSALLLVLAGAGTYFSYTNRHAILGAVKAKLGAKLKKA